MHYVPEPLREWSPSVGRSSGTDEDPDRLRYSYAPLYFLTFVVGVLLLADTLISTINDPAWLKYRGLWGYRWALLAAVAGGARILYQSLESLFEGRVGADLALTIATLAAIVLGQPSVAALVVFIALCGESLEGIVAEKARRTLNDLFDLCPRTVHRLQGDHETDIPIDELQVGDRFVVRPGERIPADGTVIQGKSSIDQSALTGEAWPVDRQEGDAVFAGTLNQFGSLQVQADQVGASTTFGQIVSMVAASTSRKAPVEKLADRLARYFLPVVLGVACLTLLFWRLSTGNWNAAWMPALSVLVVACPCPLILATPSAVLAAMSWLARRGVIIKGSDVFERLAQVDVIAFDKTGTLTQGELSLTEFSPTSGIGDRDLLAIAAAADRRSEHPLGRLLVREADQAGLVLPNSIESQTLVGRGVVARFPPQTFPNIDPDATDVLVGNHVLMVERGVQGVESNPHGEVETGRTPLTMIHVALGTKYLGCMGVEDALRPQAAATIAELREAGIESFVLLTGDRSEVAAHVTRTLGLEHQAHGDLLPQDKAHWIEEQQRQGRRVAMIGDGINDAPALAIAHAGLALGGVGSQIAAEAGDLILMGDPLTPIPGLLRISRAVVRTIRQSILWFAFGMNLTGILLSAFGVINPVGAALFHEGASLAVMLNSLRLLWFEDWGTTWFGANADRLLNTIDRVLRILSPSTVVTGLMRHYRIVVRLGLAFGLAAWSLSNLTLLTEQETAVVTRLGRFQQQLEPGLHLRWPYPLERVTRLPWRQLRSVSLGFRSLGTGKRAEGFVPPIEWQAEHSEVGYQPISAESQILSGEEVPVEMTAELQYQISDPRLFLFSGRDNEFCLRVLLESSLRQLMAREKLEDILTTRRARLEQAVLRKVTSKLDDYRLGIQVRNVLLLDVHPPLAVVPDYRKVSDALELKEQLVNEGQRTYIRELMTAIGEPALLALTAGDARVSRGTLGKSPSPPLTAELWHKIADPRQESPLISGKAAGELSDAQLERARQRYLAQGTASEIQSLARPYRQQPALVLMQWLAEFWEQALSEMTWSLWDPRVKGRRQLFLKDGVSDPPLPSMQQLPASVSPEAAEDEPPNALLPPPARNQTPSP